MKLYISIIALSLLTLIVASPTYAKKTDGEILQDSVDAYQGRLEDYKNAFDDAQNLTIPVSEDPEDRSLFLADMIYNEATPLFATVLADIKAERANTKYLKGISSLDRRNVRLELQETYIELYAFKADMDDAMNEDTSSKKLNGVRSAVGKAEGYLNTNNESWHDSLLVFVKSKAEAFEASYAESQDNVDEIYDAYSDEVSDAALETFVIRRNRFSAYYSEGVALLNRANDSSEARRLQLYIRSINKFAKAKDQLEKTYSAVNDLEAGL